MFNFLFLILKLEVLMSHTYTLFHILDNNEFDNHLKYFMLLFMNVWKNLWKKLLEHSK